MLSRVWRCWSAVALVALVCCAASHFAAGQEESPSGNAEKSFAELLADWAILEQQLISKEAEFHATEDFRVKDELKNQYVETVRSANELIDQLRAAALKAWDQEAERPQAARTLLGIMVNDAQAGMDERVLELGDQLIARGIDPRYFARAASLERLSLKDREIFDELAIRQREAQTDDLPRVKLTTTQGEIVLELFENEAPQTVGNFVHLVESGFYDGVAFHRVIDGFMAQSGDPATAEKSPVGYTIPCESSHPEARLHFAGSISMALLGGPSGGKDTGDSQFFLVFKRSLSTQGLDRKHTVFGRVLSGMDVLAKLTRTHVPMGREEYQLPDVTADKILKAEVLRKRDHEYRPTKVGETSAADAPPIEPPASGDQSQGKSDDESGDGN